MRPPTFLGLYWSIRGEVACEKHAPDTDDPRWTIEGRPTRFRLARGAEHGISVSIAQPMADRSFSQTTTRRIRTRCRTQDVLSRSPVPSASTAAAHSS